MNNTDNNNLQTVCANGTVADVILAHPEVRPLLEKIGIDYCCGGKKPFAQAVHDAGLKLQDVMAQCAKIKAEAAVGEKATDWSRAGLAMLVDHILSLHHVFTRQQLPRITSLLARVQNAHAEAHGALLNELADVYAGLKAELEPHLDMEEQALFPAIRSLDEAANAGRPQDAAQHSDVVTGIARLEREHDSAGLVLARMRELSAGYAAPADACQSFLAMYEAMETLERDLHEHIHLENNILFPKASALK